VCAICGTGTFSVTQNAAACMPWTDCAANTYVTQAGSTTADQKCSACPSAQSPASMPICLPAGACLFPGSCQPGTVQVAPAAGSTPTQCASCVPGDYCAGGLTPQLRCAGGTWDDDGDPATCCAAWKTCAAGEYVSKLGSASADQVCASCPSGSYSRYTNATQCSTWTVCAPTSTTWPQGGTATAGTATSDAACADPYDRFGSPDGADGATAVAVDGSGYVYVVGNTTSVVDITSAGGIDAWVRKLDPHGVVVWTRQFGTSGDDSPAAVAVDGNGSVIIAGSTSGALTGTNAGSIDAFVRVLDSNGNTIWTRQFGTVGPDAIRGVAVDGSGNVFVAGSTYPTGAQSSGDPFVRKLDPSGTTVWNREFGGPDEDEAFAVAVDKGGNAYVAGYTYGLTSNLGSQDAFVRKFDANGATVWTQQFGSPDHDQALAAAVDGNGNLYVGGVTSGVFEDALASLGSADAWVRKLDPTGVNLWTQQIGTSGNDLCSGLGVDGNNDVFVVGSTDGSFPGSGNAGSGDIFVRKLDPSGATLWTKQIGTSKDDSPQGAVADSAGDVYVVGSAGDDANPNAVDAFVLQVPATSP
jgi:hypothetical protein